MLTLTTFAKYGIFSQKVVMKVTMLQSYNVGCGGKDTISKVIRY